MKKTKILAWFATMLALLAFGAHLSQGDRTPEGLARKLFAKYRQYQAQGDARLGELLDDAAVIRTTRLESPTTGKTVTITAARYRELLGRTSSAARTSIAYLDPTFATEGERIRINAKRTLQNQTHPPTAFSLLVGPDPSGTWKIFEEITEIYP